MLTAPLLDAQSQKEHKFWKTYGTGKRKARRAPQPLYTDLACLMFSYASHVKHPGEAEFSLKQSMPFDSEPRFVSRMIEQFITVDADDLQTMKDIKRKVRGLDVNEVNFAGLENEMHRLSKKEVLERLIPDVYYYCILRQRVRGF